MNDRETLVLSNKSKAIGFILLSALGFAMMSVFTVRLAGDLPLHKNPFSATRLRWSWQRCCSNAMGADSGGRKGNPPLCSLRVMRHARHFCNHYAIDRPVLADANIFE